MYVCPVGEALPHRRNVIDSGLEQKVYVNHIACRDCKIRTQCTQCTQSKTEPRKMRRWIHEADIDAMKARLDGHLKRQSFESKPWSTRLLLSKCGWERPTS